MGVIDHDQVDTQQQGDGLGDRVVDPVTAHEPAEGFEGEPGDLQAVVDGVVAEGLEEVALPVPDGPATQRFSWRATHSSVRNACCVAAGIDDTAGSPASKVLPLGKPAWRRRSAMVAASRPTFSASSMTGEISRPPVGIWWPPMETFVAVYGEILMAATPHQGHTRFQPTAQIRGDITTSPSPSWCSAPGGLTRAACSWDARRDDVLCRSSPTGELCRSA